MTFIGKSNSLPNIPQTHAFTWDFEITHKIYLSKSLQFRFYPPLYNFCVAYLSWVFFSVQFAFISCIMFHFHFHFLFQFHSHFHHHKKKYNNKQFTQKNVITLNLLKSTPHKKIKNIFFSESFINGKQNTFVTFFVWIRLL